MSKKITPEFLYERFILAKKGMFWEDGIWTVMAYESCTNCIGLIELKDGRKAQVSITIQADEGEWEENFTEEFE